MKLQLIFFVFAVLLLVHSTWAADKIIVATNGWTAAYVRAAGWENVTSLASPEMLHPSEYELRIEDMMILRKADLIVFAGYEVMSDQLRKSRYVDQDKLLKIETGYNLKMIKGSILKIAEKTGTLNQATINIENIEQEIAETRELFIKNKWDEIPVLVHFFQQQLAGELGLNVVDVFGPAPPEAFEIKRYIDKDFNLIIDNIHNPAGGAIERSAKCKRVELINFPGIKKTNTLSDVIKFNVVELKKQYRLLNE